MGGFIHRYHLRLAFCSIALALSWFAMPLPQIRALEHFQETLRFELSPDNRNFNSAVVAIDTASLRAMPDWPWTRERYAELLEQLNEAGVKAVAFDIDFSARRPGDEAFGEAIRQSSAPVYLATYRQEYDGMPGVVAEISPNSTVLSTAKLASTVFPVDPDGVVRDMPPAEHFSNGPVPQLAPQLTGRQLDGPRGIDFAQDVSELPIISFTDVLARKDVRDQLNGRVIFVGATATELGDQFALPGHGLMSGVVLNAIAYETARRHTEKTPGHPLIGLLLVAIAAIAASIPLTEAGIRKYTLINFGVFAGIFTTGFIMQALFGIMVPTTIAYVVQLAGGAIMMIMAADAYALQIFKTRMNVEKYARILKCMMRSNHDGILLINRANRIESLNLRAADLLGMPREDLMNASITEQAPDLLDVKQGMPALLEIAGQDGVTRFVEASATRVALPVSGSRYEKRKSIRTLTLFTLHDLTAQKQAEQAERDAKEQHARASAAKSTLINTMTHELRTPLNAVCGFADLIADSTFGEHSTPEYAEFGEMIRSGGKQLLGVVNDMLLATRLQSREVEPESRKFALREAVDDALGRARLRQSWTDPVVHLDLGDIRLEADYDLTVTAIYHLIDNAGKFAGASGEVWISADPKTAAIIVEDNGPGPGVNDLNSLKELFQQGDGSRTRSFEGCGLGLFLVDHVARLHGGELKLSARNEGGFRAEFIYGAACSQKQGPATAAA